MPGRKLIRGDVLVVLLLMAQPSDASFKHNEAAQNGQPKTELFESQNNAGFASGYLAAATKAGGILSDYFQDSEQLIRIRSLIKSLWQDHSGKH